jgi:uncharacterized RDD family membrane protein YckC
LVAWIIDAIIVGVGQGILTAILSGIGGQQTLGGPVHWLVTLLGFAYYVYFWHMQGATPGKMAMGLRVVNDQGTNPTLSQAIIRVLVMIISGAVLFIGYLWALGRERRTWHDLAAGTYVIHQQ